MKSPSLESFEETYKRAYSHGLEDIYSIKTVDLKTVKKLQVADPGSFEDQKKCSVIGDSSREEQLEMDLGDTYRGWITPFIWREPISVLGLNRQAETCLKEHDMLLLRDLIGKDLRELVFLKGIGQGHIDEIQQQVKDYIGHRSLERMYHVEFQSWIKVIFAGLDAKQAAVFLQSYGFERLILLSKAEAAEVKHADLTTKDQWIEACREELSNEARIAEVHDDMRRIVNVFIIPWIRFRNYKASRLELMQRLERISDSDGQAHQMINFFSEVFYEKRFPLENYLFSLDQDVYCCDKFYASAYKEIIERAQTYFYRPTTHYILAHLVSLLAREFSHEWKAYSDDIIIEALRTSSKFRVTKGPSGNLEARLA